MLIHLSIRHLAVVEHLELHFKPGMTVLTGETGAGKSILIDALQLVLGERAESSIIRPGCSQAEITATFDYQDLPLVATWLSEQELTTESECIIRRTLTIDGRSRSYINGRVVPLNQLRELGECLVNIHGQHQHQLLLKPDHQRFLVDEYAVHPDALKQTQKDYSLLQNLRQQYKNLMEQQNQSDKLALLQYQIQELEELNLQEKELQSLETEQKELANVEEWLLTCETTLNHLKNDSGAGAFSAIYQAIQQINHLKNHTLKLNTCHELLTNALIQLEEGIHELEHFKDSLSIEPHRLITVNERLSQIYTLARKHRIPPEELIAHQERLTKEANTLRHLQTNLETLQEQLKTAEQHYYASAEALSQSRQQAASLLEQQITESLKSLELPNGKFKIEFSRKNELISPLGIDQIEFLVSTNPGLPLQSLRKIASGGELSRISLAIQVITAQKMTTPTLIFDEVDAGISGKTAETVGKLLRKLGLETQVLCVTHLPQIAAQGMHHYKVTKTQTKETTTSDIISLDKLERVKEIARMLGGAAITQHALLHAEEMLENA